MKRFARQKKQKQAVRLAMHDLAKHINMPCKISLTRFAPRMLDHHDNLPTSFKYIVDMVAAVITGDYRPGRADSDPRLSFSYDQVKAKEYAVKIAISF